METDFEARKQGLLDEGTVAPQIFDRVMPRLERFMEPFVESLVRRGGGLVIPIGKSPVQLPVRYPSVNQ